MNHSTQVFGGAESVISRFGSENGITRPLKLLDVLCYNNTAGVLYMHVFNITGLIPLGTTYNGIGYIGGVFSFVVGHQYLIQFGANDTEVIMPGLGIITSDQVFTATNVYATFYGTPNAAVTVNIWDLTAPATATPASGSTPKYAFPVQSGLGGTLGRSVDMQGIFCGWSSTALTYTPVVAASGSIQIVVKQ